MMNMNTIVCPEGVINGCEMTKEKRQELYGQVAGGGGSRKPEEYQRQQIEAGTAVPCMKTNMRINKRSCVMEDNAQPMRKDDGYDWTENFDGIQQFGSDQKLNVWINLKSVVGAGGSQTRTLRDECYPFVEEQLCYLVKARTVYTYFANIFDGDEAASNMSKFHYLLGLPAYAGVKKYVYVGDLKGYFDWLKTIG